MKREVGASGASPSRVEFSGDVIRCSCPKTGLPKEDLATVVRIHGFRPGREGIYADLLPCPNPGLVEPNAFQLVWTRRSLTPTGLILIALVLGMAAALATHQLMVLVPLVFGATLQVNTGRAIVTNRLRGAGTEPLYLGWGTGAQTTTLATDTTLGPTTVEKDVDLATNTGTRTTGTSSQVTTSTTNDTWQNVATRTATGAGTVTVAGYFDNSAIASGNLYMKGDFAGIALAIGDAIQFTGKVQYT